MGRPRSSPRRRPDPSAPGPEAAHGPSNTGDAAMLKFIGGTIGVIFLIGLLVVVGLFALIF